MLVPNIANFTKSEFNEFLELAESDVPINGSCIIKTTPPPIPHPPFQSFISEQALENSIYTIVKIPDSLSVIKDPFSSEYKQTLHYLKYLTFTLQYIPDGYRAIILRPLPSPSSSPQFTLQYFNQMLKQYFKETEQNPKVRIYLENEFKNNDSVAKLEYNIRFVEQYPDRLGLAINTDYAMRELNILQSCNLDSKPFIITSNETSVKTHQFGVFYSLNSLTKMLSPNIPIILEKATFAQFNQIKADLQ